MGLHKMVDRKKHLYVLILSLVKLVTSVPQGFAMRNDTMKCLVPNEFYYFYNGNEHKNLLVLYLLSVFIVVIIHYVTKIYYCKSIHNLENTGLSLYFKEA